MSERIKTLVLDADGAGWPYVAVDTVLRGLLRSPINVSILPHRFRSNRWGRRLLGPRYGHLSYVLDWREALCAAPELEVEVCNINNLLDYRRRRSSLALPILPMVELVELVFHVALERAHLFRGLSEAAPVPHDVAQGEAPTDA